MFHIQVNVDDGLRGQYDCHSIGIFARSRAGMTSQIRPLYFIIISVGGDDCTGIN